MTRPPTSFEEKVYDATRSIPLGKVTTYGALGRMIGCRSAQAIGQALQRNPFAPEVPCHRVIKGDLTIGGFFGETSGADVQRKEAMLRKEGVTFPNGKLADKSMLWEG